MSTGAHDFEALLREALAPIDPPADLANRLEVTLVNLTELAQEELDAWEMSAMRDPRNWVRPAAAAVVGATPGPPSWCCVCAAVTARANSSQRACSSSLDAPSTTSPWRHGGSSRVGRPTAPAPPARGRPLIA